MNRRERKKREGSKKKKGSETSTVSKKKGGSETSEIVTRDRDLSLGSQIEKIRAAIAFSDGLSLPEKKSKSPNSTSSKPPNSPSSKRNSKPVNSRRTKQNSKTSKHPRTKQNPKYANSVGIKPSKYNSLRSTQKVKPKSPRKKTMKTVSFSKPKSNKKKRSSSRSNQDSLNQAVSGLAAEMRDKQETTGNSGISLAGLLQLSVAIHKLETAPKEPTPKKIKKHSKKINKKYAVLTFDEALTKKIFKKKKKNLFETINSVWLKFPSSIPTRSSSSTS